MGDELIHSQFGVVWNKSIGSQAHGHERFNCRCHIIPQIHAEDLQEKIQLLMKNILEFNMKNGMQNNGIM